MRAARYTNSFADFSAVYGATGETDIKAELTDIEKLEVGQEAVIKVSGDILLLCIGFVGYHLGFLHDTVFCANKLYRNQLAPVT